MIEFTTHTRKWGNSIGILVPHHEGIEVNEPVHVALQQLKKISTGNDLFGKTRKKFDTETLLKEVDRELDH